MDTSAAREPCSSVDVACHFGCCALLIRVRPSQAASTSNDGRGLCPAGFSRWRLPPLPITLRLTRDQLIRYTRDPAKECAQLC